MRILFSDLIYDATLSADYENANYPLTNIQEDHMKKIYKSTTTSATITITLSESSTVNCCYIGFTNATSASLALYNSSDTLLRTVTLDTSRGGKSFTSTSSVSYAILTLSGSATIYVGTIGIGDNYEMPEPDDGFVPIPINNGTITYSGGGQIYNDPVPIRHKLDVTYSFHTIDEFNEVLAEIEDQITTGHNAWVDPYEENTGAINPMWCHLDFGDDPTESWGYYDWTHEYTEVL